MRRRLSSRCASAGSTARREPTTSAGGCSASPRAVRAAAGRKSTARSAEQLERAGQLRPAGLLQIERARADGRWEAAYASQARGDRPGGSAPRARRRPRGAAPSSSRSRATTATRSCTASRRPSGPRPARAASQQLHGDAARRGEAASLSGARKTCRAGARGRARKSPRSDAADCVVAGHGGPAPARPSRTRSPARTIPTTRLLPYKPVGVSHDEAGGGGHAVRPAAAVFGERDGVEAAAVDRHPGVFGVGVDRDVAPGPGFAVGLEAVESSGELSRPPPCRA